MTTQKPKVAISATRAANTGKPAIAAAKPATKQAGTTAKPAAKPASVSVKPVKADIVKKSSPAPVAKAAVPVKAEPILSTPEKHAKKRKKAKVVRDSFTMPEVDYAKLAELKKKCLANGVSVKKSELLRAGLHLLEALSIAKLKTVVTALDNVKTGRPPLDKAN